MKKRIVVLVVVIVFVALACFVGNRAFVMPDIHPHSGDGEFQNISRRLGRLAGPGYSIRMEEFDLNKSHDAEYCLGKMTDIHRRAYLYLGARFAAERGLLNEGIREEGARMRLELLDSRGVSLVKAEGKIGDCRRYTTSHRDWDAL